MNLDETAPVELSPGEREIQTIRELEIDKETEGAVTEAAAVAEQLVTPWEVFAPEGGVDYDKLVDKFSGASASTPRS